MDIKLVEQLLLKATPSQAHEVIHRAFIDFVKSPEAVLNNGIKTVNKEAYSSDFQVSVASINGLVMGALFSKASEDGRHVSNFFSEVIRNDDNVLDIMSYKAKKGLI